jgi:hypothetical protein
MDLNDVGCKGVEESCGQGNKSSGPIEGGKFLDWLNDYQLLKEFSPRSYSVGQLARWPASYLRGWLVALLVTLLIS